MRPQRKYLTDRTTTVDLAVQKNGVRTEALQNNRHLYTIQSRPVLVLIDLPTYEKLNKIHLIVINKMRPYELQPENIAKVSANLFVSAVGQNALVFLHQTYRSALVQAGVSGQVVTQLIVRSYFLITPVQYPLPDGGRQLLSKFANLQMTLLLINKVVKVRPGHRALGNPTGKPLQLCQSLIKPVVPSKHRHDRHRL